ncbi:energy-coupling factor ABC transporter ATP-binding protein [Sediminispirochaeta bajacaliforniensis]|uniref:energy-coupling factor ABC transporter ATP-binding protein n=1 Tax=Sediminispirochaeta bajacaliforniensis TaxID=148 RepID=UPI00037FCD3F|nr:ATP-binding cassette domain-containing protein [Sediminispirochaeta bajacaliforniensis]
MKSDSVVSIKALSCTYPGGVEALEDIDLEIYRNQFVGIIGQNGAGKSTLLQHMIGLLKPKQGEVTVLDTDTRSAAVSQLATKVGFVLQNPDLQLFAPTVREEVSFGPSNLGIEGRELEERVTSSLETVGLASQLESFPLTLSKGDRAKVVIASVLAMNPEIIILDEPTCGQDHKGNTQIMNIATSLCDAGKTIIVVTHNMDLIARYAERIIVLKKGRIHMDGSVREIFSRPKELLETHIKPPYITRLGQRLDDCLGGEETYLNVEELGESVVRRACETRTLPAGHIIPKRE